MSEEKTNPLPEISDKISLGQGVGAKRSLTKAWREAVPEIPVRFAVILVRLDEKSVLEIIKRMKKSDSPPQLKLEWRKDRIEVWTSRGKKIRIGDLPSSDSMMLFDLGGKAKKYRPQIIEIKTSEDGEIEHFAVELVRPETESEKNSSPSQTSIIEAIEDIAENVDKIDLDLDQSS